MPSAPAESYREIEARMRAQHPERSAAEVSRLTLEAFQQQRGIGFTAPALESGVPGGPALKAGRPAGAGRPRPRGHLEHDDLHRGHRRGFACRDRATATAHLRRGYTTVLCVIPKWGL